MRSARVALLAAALSFGVACASSIMPLYEEARSEALAPAGVPKPGWEPDAVLHLSNDLVGEVLGLALDEYGTLSEPVEIRPLSTTVTPTLHVDRVHISSTDRCEGCLAVKAWLTGDLAWKLAGRKGKVDVSAWATFDVELEARQRRHEWIVEVKPRAIRKTSVELGRLSAVLSRVADGAVEDWLEATLLERMPTWELGPFGAEDVPLRGLTVIPAESGVRVAMLTSSPSPTPVEVRDSKQRDGWQLDISQDSLLDLARRAAFEMGAVGYDVVSEPTSLDMGRGDFTLGLRLWRTKGRGWWRDYTVTGDATVTEGGRLKLEPRQVVEGEKSPGAALADPIALLGEGYILKTIEQSVSTSFPVRQGTTMGEHALEVSVESVWGTGNTLTVIGSLEVGGQTPDESTRGGSRTRPR